MKVLVQAPSRLHFGLISLGASSQREFGGAGLMVQDPGISLAISIGKRQTHCEDEGLGRRASAILQELVRALDIADPPPLTLEIASAPAEHQGLGTGTSLALSLAAAMTRLLGVNASTLDLARWTGRGRRSGIGIHGFSHGGFLVDGGKGPATKVAPLVAHTPFPTEWPILLFCPKSEAGISGAAEQAVFATRVQMEAGLSERLSHLILMGVLPAIAEKDYQTFAEALFELNHRVGGCFKEVQGGHYSSPLGSQMIDYLRRLDLAAVGQSSWGPTLFAIAADADHAEWIGQRMTEAFGLTPNEMLLTLANNQGATVTEVPTDA